MAPANKTANGKTDISKVLHSREASRNCQDISALPRAVPGQANVVAESEAVSAAASLVYDVLSVVWLIRCGSRNVEKRSELRSSLELLDWIKFLERAGERIREAPGCLWRKLVSGLQGTGPCHEERSLRIAYGAGLPGGQRQCWPFRQEP